MEVKPGTRRCIGCKHEFPAAEFARNGKLDAATCNTCADAARARYAAVKAKRRKNGQKTCPHCGEKKAMDAFIAGRVEFKACHPCRMRLTRERIQRKQADQAKNRALGLAASRAQGEDWAKLRFPGTDGPFSAAALGVEAMQWRAA